MSRTSCADARPHNGGPGNATPDHPQGSLADFQNGGASSSLTLFEEVLAVTIPGHLTTYRYQLEGLPEQRGPPVWALGGSRVGRIPPDMFGPSPALKGD
jgi:hypothetical protein